MRAILLIFLASCFLAGCATTGNPSLQGLNYWWELDKKHWRENSPVLDIKTKSIVFSEDGRVAIIIAGLEMKEVFQEVYLIYTTLPLMKDGELNRVYPAQWVLDHVIPGKVVKK